MTATTTPVLVTAALLIDVQKRVLLARRPEGKPLAGLWEFPGGKVHDAELPEDALIRELKEELGLTVSPDDLFPMTFVTHKTSTDKPMLMLIYGCQTWQGTPHPHEGQELTWAAPEAWTNYTMPHADVLALSALSKLLDMLELQDSSR